MHWEVNDSDLPSREVEYIKCVVDRDGGLGGEGPERQRRERDLQETEVG